MKEVFLFAKETVVNPMEFVVSCNHKPIRDLILFNPLIYKTLKHCQL